MSSVSVRCNSYAVSMFAKWSLAPFTSEGLPNRA